MRLLVGGGVLLPGRQAPSVPLTAIGRRQTVKLGPAGIRQLRHMDTSMRAVADTLKSEGQTTSSASASNGQEPDNEDAKSDDYSATMQQQMGGSLEYRHEAGMNYAVVLDNLLVGSCLQTAADVDTLAEKEGVGAVFCLQEDSDMAWFDLDVAPIIERCRARGDIRHIRYRIRDFDPFDLRLRLPGAVQIVADEVAAGRKVYIHCTAGMGRAPATALAYMCWCRGMSLAAAFSRLRSVRACNPRLVAIRQAACDLLLDGGLRQKVVIAICRTGSAQRVQIAGLDVGWGQRIDLEREPETGRYVTERSLPVGKFPYRLVYDETLWTWSADHPVMVDGNHTNNYVEVVGSPAAVQARERIMSEEGDFTPQERQQLEAWFADGRYRDGPAA